MSAVHLTPPPAPTDGSGRHPAVPGCGDAPLPAARGPVSAHVRSVLVGHVASDAPPPEVHEVPLGDEDQTLALYLLYELTYRGFVDVKDALEWNVGLLALRTRLEETFLVALHREVDMPEPSGDVVTDLRDLLEAGGDAPSVSGWCRDHGGHVHLVEQAVHRAPYQLKEADPHSWLLPRLHGEPKSALVRIQSDEYGEGRQRDAHAELFALHMDRLGLESAYGHHLDAVPGPSLATVNLISLFGLHRRWRAAAVGHLALFEMASVPVMANFSAALRRLGYDSWTRLFYDVHVVADAEHQSVAAHDLAGGLVRQDPGLAGDVLFGAAALQHLEALVASRTVAAWEDRTSSLLEPVEVGRAPGLHEQRLAGDDPRDGLVA